MKPQDEGATAWRDHHGQAAVVHIPEWSGVSYAARSAPAVLREAEQAIAALQRILEPPREEQAKPVHIYLTDPVTGSLGGEPAAVPTADQTGAMQAPSRMATAPPAWLLHAGQRHELKGDVTLVGSSRHSDVFLDDPSVARCQAFVCSTGTGYLLSAMGGTNPTVVNGRPVIGRHTLQPGDLIRLGESELRFECEAWQAQAPVADGDAIVRDVDPETPLEPLAYPLARLLIPRWFGSKLASASLFLDGTAGVVCARTGTGPSIQETHAWARSELQAGRPVSILSPPPTSPASGATELAVTSFVAFLLEKFGTSAFRQVLRSYDPDRRDQASLTAYERTLAGLEEAWLASLRRSGGTAVLRSFFRHVVPLLRPYWPRELEVLGYMLVEMLYGLAIPLSSKWLVDTVIPARSVQLLLFFVLALLGMYVLDALIGMRRVYVSESINQRLLMNLQERMFSHLQRLPHAFYSEAKVGDIMSRLTHDVFSVEAALAQVTGVGVFLGLKALVTAVVLIVLSPILGAVVLFVVPLFAVSYFVLRSKLQTASYEAQKVAGEVASVTQENLSAHPVVKAFGLEGRAVASYHARLLSAFKVGLRLTMIGALFETSMGLATTFGQLVVLGVGGYLIITGHITVGTLLAFIGLLASLFIPIAMLSSAGHTLQSASGALDRVSELLEAPVSIIDAEAAVPLPPLTREIRLEHVTFGYASPRAVLVDVTLTIPAGRHIAIVGPSGSGKSTLVNLLLRFWDVGEGAILADGQDIRGVSLESLRGQIGVVFQDTFVFDTTVRENIGIGRLGASDEEVVATAKAAQLDSYVDSLPAGYDTVLGERGVRMSGGQRQRLAIARALLRDPRILILDEATSALDAQTESEILESLMRLASGRTTISVTHRLSLAALADHIFVLDQGRLVEEGPHGELVKAGGLYQRMYQEQMRHVLGGGRFGSIDAAHLRAVPLFKDLSDQAMATVASRMRLERHPANYDVVRQGDAGDKFYVIGSGKVEVLIHDHTGERRINTLTGDEYFGEMALLTGESRTATVRTTIPTELYSLSRADFMELLEQDPAIYRAAGAMLASRRAALVTAAAGMGTTSS